MKHIFIYVCALFLIILFVSSGFMLFSDKMFGFHDSTQAARIIDFSYAIKSGHIPPRVSDHFSYGMGYPVFNFYAPFSYWVTSLFHIVGFSVPTAIKLSFLSAVFIGAMGTLLLLSTYFSLLASFLGALLFATSPYIALEVYVRGNLAEMWFIALLPIVLYLIRLFSKKPTRFAFTLLAISFSALLTSHNALSIIGAGLVLVYTGFHKEKRLLAYSMGLGLMLSSYFLLPAFLELSMTHAKNVARMTNFVEHFVCPKQIWSSQWGFGGSTAGCIDGMSFMLGKMLLILAIAGGFLWLYKGRVKNLNMGRGNTFSFLFFGATGVVAVFLSIDVSTFIWVMAGDFLSLFQFPWRFLGLCLLPLSFYAAYCIDVFSHVGYKYIVAIMLTLVVIFTSRQYFIANPDKTFSHDNYMKKYASEEYIKDEIAYRVPEYLPKTADYKVWRSLQDDPNSLHHFTSLLEPFDGLPIEKETRKPYFTEVVTQSQHFALNKYYLPYWIISMNGKLVKPDSFDLYGRPVLKSNALRTTITVKYKQTSIERAANGITVAALLLICMSMHQYLWKKLHR